MALLASSSASVEAAAGALTLTAGTSTTATASNGDFTVSTSAGGTKITLQTATTAEEVEITRGLLKSAAATALQITGRTSVDVRAESGALALTAATAATMRASSGSLQLTGATSVGVTAQTGSVELNAAGVGQTVSVTADSDIILATQCTTSTGCSKITLDPQSSQGYVDVKAEYIKGTSSSGLKLQAKPASGAGAITLDSLGGTISLIGDVTISGSLTSAGTLQCSTTAPGSTIQSTDQTGNGFTIESNPSNGGDIILNPQSDELVVDASKLTFEGACNAASGMTIQTTAEASGSCSTLAEYMDIILDPAGGDVILTSGIIESGYNAVTGGDVPLALTGTTSVAVRAKAGTLEMSASTSAALTAENGDLVLTAPTDGTEIKLTTQGTANAVEVTRGLVRSGSGAKLALTGTTSVAVRAESGALGMTASTSASLRATSGALTLTASGAATLSAGTGALTLTAGGSATIDANGGALALTGSSTVSVRAENGDVNIASSGGGRAIRLETASAADEVEITRGLLTSAGGTALQVTGTTSVSVRALSGSMVLLASTAASVEAAGGALTMTASTSTTATASSGDFTVVTSAGGTKIALRTATTSEEVEITRGLLKSAAATALQITGTTSVALRAESGPMALLASGAASIEAAGGALTLTGTSATLSSSGTSLDLTGATSISLTAAAAGVDVTGATSAALTASAGDATITASGSIVLAGNVELTHGLQVAATVVAAAGTVQGDAAAIGAGLSMVSVTNTGAGQGVLLPTPTAGTRITLLRATASNEVKVYPAGTDTINGALASVALAMSVATNIMTCVALSTAAWECTRVGTETFAAIDLESGASYSIGDTAVLSATALGSAVVGSSLTSVGTLTSLAVADDVTIYNGANDGNPVLSLGSGPSERLKVTSQYTSGGNTLEKVVFDTASTVGGTYEWMVQGSSEMTLTSSALDLASGSSITIGGAPTLTASGLGSAVLASSLTSVGVLTNLDVAGGITGGDDVTIYTAITDGNPVFSLGSTATNRIKITSTYTAGTTELASVDFDTPSTSASATAGAYNFKIKGTERMSLVTDSLSIPTGSAYKINNVEVLSAAALGGNVFGSSLTSVGTLVSVTVSGATTLNGAVVLGDGGADLIAVNGKMSVSNGFQQIATTVAAAGANQGAATAITAGLSSIRVTSASGNEGVLLPNPSAGSVVTLIRGTATHVVKVYPGLGHTANGGGVNAPLDMGAADQVFVCTGMSTTAWECIGHGGGAVTTGTRRRLLVDDAEVPEAVTRGGSSRADRGELKRLRASVARMENGLLLALGSNGVLFCIIALMLFSSRRKS
jgi:hypothetical protein